MMEHYCLQHLPEIISLWHVDALDVDADLLRGDMYADAFRGDPAEWIRLLDAMRARAATTPGLVINREPVRARRASDGGLLAPVRSEGGWVR